MTWTLLTREARHFVSGRIDETTLGPRLRITIGADAVRAFGPATSVEVYIGSDENDGKLRLVGQERLNGDFPLVPMKQGQAALRVTMPAPPGAVADAVRYQLPATIERGVIVLGMPAAWFPVSAPAPVERAKVEPEVGDQAAARPSLARWTPDEDAKAIEMRRQGVAVKLIAAALGRSEKAVGLRLHKINHNKLIRSRSTSAKAAA